MKVIALIIYGISTALVFLIAEKIGYSRPMVLDLSKVSGPLLMPVLAIKYSTGESMILKFALYVAWITPPVLMLVKFRSAKQKLLTFLAVWIICTIGANFYLVFKFL